MKSFNALFEELSRSENWLKETYQEMVICYFENL